MTTTCTSNSFIFNVHNTGSPGHDLQRHISNLPDVLRRVFEELRLTGTQLSRIEPDIAAATKREQEVRIATIEYAAAQLGSREDAVEFVRCLKRIAGEGAGAQSFQQIASHYYKQAREAGTAATLGEMGVLAFHLDATTDEGELRSLGEFDIEQNYVADEVVTEVELTDDLTDSERRELSAARAAEILDEREEHPFFAELRSQRRRVPQIAKFVEDDFRRRLRDDYTEAGSPAEEVALHEQYERLEQYDENGIVSLHMSDGERVVPCGDLTDDVTIYDLPEAARHLGYEMCRLYKSGFPSVDRGPREGVAGIPITTFRRSYDRGGVKLDEIIKTSYGIDTWLDYSLENIYHRSTRTRTMRRVVSITNMVMGREGSAKRHTFPHEQVFNVEVFPFAEEEVEARAVLDILFTKLKADIHMRALNTSALYRELYAQIPIATDTAVLSRLRKQAWDLKQEGRLSLKFFTLLNTFAAVRIARLETEPLRTRMREEDRERVFQVAQPVINSLAGADGNKLADIARRISRLPRQEQERVRRALKARHPELYGRVRDGLCRRIEHAPAKSYDPQIRSLGYFRWAMYPGNKVDHPSNLLTREDQAAAWALLKARTALSAHPSTRPQSPVGNAGEAASSMSDLPISSAPALPGSDTVH